MRGLDKALTVVASSIPVSIALDHIVMIVAVSILR